MDYVAVARAGVPTVEGLLIVKPPYGRITAIDVKSGETAWLFAGEGCRAARPAAQWSMKIDR